MYCRSPLGLFPGDHYKHERTEMGEQQLHIVLRFKGPIPPKWYKGDSKMKMLVIKEETFAESLLFD